MSKAFTKEVDDAPDDNDLIGTITSDLPPGVKNYMTPHGYKRLADELRYLTERGRPVTQKREARVQFLRQRIEQAEIVDPARRSEDRVFFGATVRFQNRAGEEKRVSIVGVDELDIAAGYITFISPLAKALLRARSGDAVAFQSPGGFDELEILEVSYREIPMKPFLPAD